LTNLGYDYLALRVLAKRGSITGIAQQIGVGKESGALLLHLVIGIVRVQTSISRAMSTAMSSC
jgi:hypothetical protein